MTISNIKEPSYFIIGGTTKAGGDLDGDASGMDDVIMDIGGNTWVRYNNGAQWRKLMNYIPNILATGDLDGDAGGMDDVIVDIGGNTWVRNNNGAQWQKLINGVPELCATGDIDGN